MKKYNPHLIIISIKKISIKDKKIMWMIFAIWGMNMNMNIKVLFNEKIKIYTKIIFMHL